MLDRLKIRGKIWVGITAVIAGYVSSMALSIYLGRNGERVILSITETLLPATSLSQRALEAYQNQLKSYDDAVVLGESAYVKQAQDYAQQAIGALNELRELKNLGPTRLQELSNIDTKLRYFTEMAQDKYTQMANGAGGIERDPLKDNRAILEVRLTTLERAISEALRASLDEVVNDRRREQAYNLALFIVSILISVGVVQNVISRLILRPLHKTVTMLEALREGRLDLRLNIKTPDEIGRMARAMDSFVDSLRQKVQLAENIASGDLAVRVELASDQDTLGSAMNQMAENLKGHRAAIELNIRDLETQAIALQQANDDLVSEIAERKEAERKLAETQEKLVSASRQAGMAEVATGVLHNVGNVLNSVNVSANLINEKLETLELSGLDKAINLIEDHTGTETNFWTDDGRAKQLPRYLKLLGERFDTTRSNVYEEMASLNKNIAHIKDIVSVQQAYARTGGVFESTDPVELIEDTLNINRLSINRANIKVQRNLTVTEKVRLDRQKVLQILVNLVKNAADSIRDSKVLAPEIEISVIAESGKLAFAVQDNGMGIDKRNLTRIFAHGFTTKHDGHGFGLHTAALAAQEMGGSTAVKSPGLGLGATFELKLPLKWSRDV